VASGVALTSIKTQQSGQFGTLDWSMYFLNQSGERVSPWHHLALRPTPEKGSPSEPLINFVNEIPRGTRAKLEITTKVEFNPIKQDNLKKTGAPRSFTYGDIPFNYGALPQTWEDSRIVDKRTGCKGDGDPVDVVELGSTPLEIGAIRTVRVLGVLALIDEGETDWKIITAPLESEWQRLGDVPQSVIGSVQHWFRYYKTTDGKPENAFAFDGVVKGVDLAMEVIEETEGQWKGAVDSGALTSLGFK
jgi:inorganic pyrophosphatase